MYFVRIIDENGLFVDDVFVEELTEYTIETPVIGTFYHPKWNGTEWVEGGQPPEPVPQLPTDSERLQALEDTILTILMEG